jgi:hypothetical protein
MRGRSLVALLLIATSVGPLPARSQSIGPPVETFPLPISAGQFQPVPSSPIHGTTWSFRRVTESGHNVPMPKDAVVLFEWGDMQGESMAYLYDGCEVSQSAFAWATSELFIAPRSAPFDADPCTTNKQKAIRKSFSGTFVRRVNSVISTGTTMTLVAGKRTIELVRRPENPLSGAAWATTDSTFKQGVGRINGNVSFGPSTYRSSDGCNGMDGTYMYVGGKLVVLSGSQTMMGCDWPSFGWIPGGTSDAKVTSRGLTITSRSGVHPYRKITAVPAGA